MDFKFKFKFLLVFYFLFTFSFLFCTFCNENFLFVFFLLLTLLLVCTFSFDRCFVSPLYEPTECWGELPSLPPPRLTASASPLGSYMLHLCTYSTRQIFHLL